MGLVAELHLWPRGRVVTVCMCGGKRESERVAGRRKPGEWLGIRCQLTDCGKAKRCSVGYIKRVKHPTKVSKLFRKEVCIMRPMMRTRLFADRRESTTSIQCRCSPCRRAICPCHRGQVRHGTAALGRFFLHRRSLFALGRTWR
jgi:hypothetical protein